MIEGFYRKCLRKEHYNQIHLLKDQDRKEKKNKDQEMKVTIHEF